jgi:hypothetical protein
MLFLFILSVLVLTGFPPAMPSRWAEASKPETARTDQGALAHLSDHVFPPPPTSQPSRLQADAPWSANVKVNDDAGTADQRFPAIAVDDSGNAYAMWGDVRSGRWDVNFSYRATGGSWGPNVKVNDNVEAANLWFPSIAVDVSGNAHAAWADPRTSHYDIFYSHRPTGESWAPNMKVSDDTSPVYQDCPSIAVDSGGNAYAVWTGAQCLMCSEWDVYFSYRPAGGNWQANSKVNDDAGTAGYTPPSVAVDAGGNAYAVWSDSRNGNADIYFSYRPAGGAWGANVKVNDDAGTTGQYRGAIAVDANGNAYAVWEDWRNGNADIYFSNRPVGGVWGANVKVNDETGTAGNAPSVAVDASGNGYAIWQDWRNGNSDIFFAHRPAGGAWGANVKVNDDVGTASQIEAAIAVDANGNAYAVWEDWRNGNADIYFSYRPAYLVYLPVVIRN